MCSRDTTARAANSSGAHSGDCDRPFRPKVITDSGDRDHAVMGPRKARRGGGSDLHRRHGDRLHKKADAGQDGRGSSTESMEGTRARRVVPSRATERRARGGAVGPRGRSGRSQSCRGAVAGKKVAAQRRAFEIDAMRAVDNAVQDGVGEGGIADDLVPTIHRDLAGD